MRPLADLRVPMRRTATPSRPSSRCPRTPSTACEVCDAPAERVLSAPAIHFKGSGFYTTDYARKGKKKPDGDGGSAARLRKETGLEVREQELRLEVVGQAELVEFEQLEVRLVVAVPQPDQRAGFSSERGSRPSPPASRAAGASRCSPRNFSTACSHSSTGTSRLPPGPGPVGSIRIVVPESPPIADRDRELGKGRARPCR